MSRGHHLQHSRHGTQSSYNDPRPPAEREAPNQREDCAGAENPDLEPRRVEREPLMCLVTGRSTVPHPRPLPKSPDARVQKVRPAHRA